MQPVRTVPFFNLYDDIQITRQADRPGHESPHPTSTTEAISSIGGHGPAIVGGMLFMGSGYNLVTAAPGNALIAFGVE